MTDNRSRMKGLHEALFYQKKAAQALLPESAAGHLDVIGQELKAMAKEMMMECYRHQMEREASFRDKTGDPDTFKEEYKTKDSGPRKVNIE